MGSLWVPLDRLSLVGTFHSYSQAEVKEMFMKFDGNKIQYYHNSVFSYVVIPCLRLFFFCYMMQQSGYFIKYCP